MLTQNHIKWTRVIGYILSLGGIIVLLGWAWNIEVVKMVFPGLTSMKANTALCMSLIGFTIILLAREHHSAATRYAATIIDAGMFILVLLTLIEYFSGLNFGIDEWMFRDSIASTGMIYPGRMAPATAFCFILTCIALGMVAWTSSLGKLHVSILTALGASLILFGGISSLLQLANALFHLPLWNYTGMAFNTAVGFVLVGFGLLLLRGEVRNFQWNLDKKTTIGLLAISLSTLTIFGVSWNNTLHLQEAAALGTQTNEVLKEIENIRADMALLESSQRGYLILGEEELLHGRKEIKDSVQTSLKSLRKLMQDESMQKRIAHLESLIKERTDFGEKNINERREHGFAASQKMLATHIGINLNNEIREVITSMRNDEYALLNAQQMRSKEVSSLTFLFLPMEVYLSLTILALSCFILNQSMSERVEAETHLRATLKEVGDLKIALDEHAIVAITDPRGRITYVNDKFCGISKYSREELIGQDHRIVNSGYHSKEFIRNLWATISRGKVWHGEIKNRAKDGSIYWVETTVVPFLDEKGKPRQYVAIRADVTARKLAEEEIRDLNTTLEKRVTERTAQLEAANKEMESFSYSVSHDLRAPLRHMDGFVGMLSKHLGEGADERSKRYIGIIADSAKRMGTLIDDLLVFSRMSRSEIRKTEVSSDNMVKEVMDSMEEDWKERSIEWDISPLPNVQADASMLRQVWVNLISNAVKYSRTRNPARIQIGTQEDDPEQHIFYVRDNGVGFDMQYAGKLFGVFQRLHRSDEFEGTGIGLANVQRIVSRQGGRAWADAKLNEGATFFFSLPKNNLQNRETS